MYGYVCKGNRDENNDGTNERWDRSVAIVLVVVLSLLFNCDVVWLEVFVCSHR